MLNRKFLQKFTLLSIQKLRNKQVIFKMHNYVSVEQLDMIVIIL